MWTMDDLIAKARIKFDWHIDPLQLGSQFFKAQQAMDMPRMITPLEPSLWRNFFTEEAKNLKGKILK